MKTREGPAYAGAESACGERLDDGDIVKTHRRVCNTREMIYTAGGRISLESEGLSLPLYARLYFMLRGTEICAVLLLSGDGGRYPLIYAADDFISAAAPHLIVDTEQKKSGSALR